MIKKVNPSDFEQELLKKSRITNSDRKELRKFAKELKNILNEQLDNAQEFLESDTAEEYFINEILTRQEVFDNLRNVFENIAKKHYNTVDELLTALYNAGRLYGYNDLGKEGITFTSTDALALMNVQNYTFSLIQNLNNDLVEGIRAKVFQAVLEGTHPYDLATRYKRIRCRTLT